MSESNWVHLDVDEIDAETDKALVEKGAFWIPLSQIADSDNYKKGDRDVTISVTEWWARKNNLLED